MTKKKIMLVILLGLIMNVYGVSVYIPNNGYPVGSSFYWKKYKDVKEYRIDNGVIYFTSKNGERYTSSIFIVED